MARRMHSSSSRMGSKAAGAAVTLFVCFLSLQLVGLCSAEEEGNNNNNNAAAGNGFYGTLQQGPCFNVKIQDDDEEEEGNSYFYNGAYRAQYQRYISFTGCTTSSAYAADDSGGTCSLYVSDLEEFIGPAVEYMQNYCAFCQQMCRRRDRTLLRFLEEEGQQEEGGGKNYNVNVDCSVCNDQCSYEYNDYEVNNLECQEDQGNYEERRARHQRRLDEDGEVQYYTGPGCWNGQVVIGKFYDDECSIKASMIQQDYPLFDALATFRMDCSNGNNEMCEELMNNAISCDDNDGGDDEVVRLCNTARKAGRARNYARRKKWYQRPGRWFALILLTGIVVGALSFLSYTYYVRHKGHRTTPMVNLDEDPKSGEQQPTSEYTGMDNSSKDGSASKTSPPWARVS